METAWTDWMTAAMAWIEQAGWMGWVWFTLLYTVSCVFFLPGSLLTVGAGAAYGFWPGTILVSVSSMVGAVVNFATSRYLLHRWLQRKFEQNQKFRSLDRAIASHGWRVILLSRVSPLVPHSLVSYACGLTTISMTRFALASWIGFIPISAAYAYTGAMIGKIARAKAGLPHGIESWIFYGLGLVITVFVTVWSMQMANRALRVEVDLPEDETASSR